MTDQPAEATAEQPPLLPEEQSQAPTAPPLPELADLGAVITPDVPIAWNIGDSPYSFYTVIYRLFGGGTHWVGVTARGLTPEKAFSDFEKLMGICESHGWSPPTVAQPATSVPPTVPASHATNPPIPDSQPPTTPPTSDGVLDRGMGEIVSITVEVNGTVKFLLNTLKYPLTDARKPDVIAGLFDQDLGWTAAHFSSPAVFNLKGYNLKADWIKKTKNVKGENKTYYDIVRIHK